MKIIDIPNIYIAPWYLLEELELLVIPSEVLEHAGSESVGFVFLPHTKNDERVATESFMIPIEIEANKDMWRKSGYASEGHSFRNFVCTIATRYVKGSLELAQLRYGNIIPRELIDPLINEQLWN